MPGPRSPWRDAACNFVSERAVRSVATDPDARAVLDSSFRTRDFEIPAVRSDPDFIAFIYRSEFGINRNVKYSKNLDQSS